MVPLTTAKASQDAMLVLSPPAGQFTWQPEIRTQNTRILLQDSRRREPLRSQIDVILQDPAASANLLGKATKPAPAARQERRRIEISSRRSFIPLSTNKPQMVFSLSEDHWAPGKPKSGRESRRQREEIRLYKHFTTCAVPF